jgi:hypothetical protein
MWRVDVDCWVSLVEAEHDFLGVLRAMVVFAVSVLAVKGGAVHGADVVGVGEAGDHVGLGCVGGVRVEAPLKILEAVTVFNDGRTEGVPHPHALLLSVLAAGRFVPVEGDEVGVECVDAVDCADVSHPHAEGPIAVDCVLLEVSIHFV